MATTNMGAKDCAGFVNKAFVPNTKDDTGELQHRGNYIISTVHIVYTGKLKIRNGHNI